MQSAKNSGRRGRIGDVNYVKRYRLKILHILWEKSFARNALRKILLTRTVIPLREQQLSAREVLYDLLQNCQVQLSLLPLQSSNTLRFVKLKKCLHSIVIFALQLSRKSQSHSSTLAMAFCLYSCRVIWQMLQCRRAMAFPSLEVCEMCS